MILFSNNQGPQARDPTVGIYKNKPVIHTKAVLESIQAAFRLIHDKPMPLQTHTTPDGLDAVIWGEPHIKLFQMAKTMRPSVAVVLSNTRRQKSAFYGGVRGEDWCLVFDRYVFRGKSRLKRENLDRVMEDSVARWSLFTDRYGERITQLKNTPLHSTKYNWLLLHAARRRLLAWSRLGHFDRTKPDYQDNAFDYLKRFSRAVALQPPISQEPARNQLWSNHEAYRLVWEV